MSQWRTRQDFYHGGGSARPQGPRCKAPRVENGDWVWGEGPSPSARDLWSVVSALGGWYNLKPARAIATAASLRTNG